MVRVKAFSLWKVLFVFVILFNIPTGKLFSEAQQPLTKEQKVGSLLDARKLLDKAKQLSYIFEIEEIEEYESGKKETVVAKVWVSGKKVKMEYIFSTRGELSTEAPGVVHIQNDLGYYIYNPKTNVAVNFTPILEIAGELPLFNFFFPADAQVAGEEEVNGKRCVILKKNHTTWWVWEKHGIALKWKVKGVVVEGKTNVIKDNYTLTGMVRRLSIEKIPESTFELPGDVKIVEGIIRDNQN